MTDSTTQSKKPTLSRRLRNNISHREHVTPSGSSISLQPPGPVGSKQKPSLLSGPPSSSSLRSANSDPTSQLSSHTGKATSTASTARGRAATSSLNGEVLEKALKLLEDPERVIIEEYISSDDIASALDHAFEAAQAKRKVCESKR
jgi:hypothetical protein